MPLNAQGEIENVTAPEKVAGVFWPLLERVVQALQTEFGDDLHSVYVYGSIAEGRAQPGRSDADFIVALQQPVAEVSARLNAVAVAVLAEFSQLVSKIDLPTGTVAEILAPEQLYGWGAYLKILGLPLFGPDLRTQLPAFQPGPQLTQAWNGDLRQQLATALRKLHSTAPDNEKLRCQRGIAGTALRAMFMRIAPELQHWSTVFAEQAERVQAFFPEQAQLYAALASARNSEHLLPEFSALLEQFQLTALPYFEAGFET